MAEIIRPLSIEIDAPDSAGGASTISDAFLVRAVNSSGTQSHKITLVQADGTEIGSTSVGANRAIIVNKNADEKIYAADSLIKLSKVTSKG